MKNRELFFLGIADMSGMILMTAIIFHYQNYYINTLFVGNSYAYLLGFLVPTISLFIGAFAYPISGYFSDRLSTRFGRRRPFFFLAIPGGISFGLVSMPMFVQIGINFSNNFLSGYIFILTFYILFVSCWRFVQCPFLALFVDVTKPEEQIKASIFLNMCDIAGTLIGIGIPLILDLSIIKGYLTPIFGYYNAIEFSGYLFGLIYIISFILAFFFGPKEDIELLKKNKNKNTKDDNFLKALKEILTIPALRNYIISAFFYVFCFNIAIYYLMPYLNSLGLSSSDIIIYAIPLFLAIIILFFVFSKISKSWGKIKTFRISLLWGAVGTPFLLVIGVTNIGPLSIMDQLVILFIILSGSIVGMLIFQYAILMDLGKLVPLKESTFVGVYSSIIVFSQPLSTFALSFLTQYLNPINIWIWNGNLGYASIGIVMGIGFLISYFFMKKVNYETQTAPENSENPENPKNSENSNNLNHNIDEQFKSKIDNLTNNKSPIKHIKKLDYPRLCGTPGEKNGVNYITSVLDSVDFHYKIEEFPVPKSSKFKKILLPLLVIVWGIISLYNVFFISGTFELIIAIIILIVPLSLIIILVFLNKLFKFILKGYYLKIKKLEKKLQFDRTRSINIKFGKNIIADYSPQKPKGHIIFTAHHDSISLLIGNMKLLTVLGAISIVSLFIYSIAYFLHYLFIVLNIPINLFGQFPVLFIIILLSFLIPISILLTIRAFRSNKSHGSIDDMTGTSILLELSKIIKEINPPFKITLAFFSGEELGLLGSGFHYYNNSDLYNDTTLISVDMIGEISPLSIVKSVSPILPAKMDQSLNELFSCIADKLGIKLKKIKFLYPGSDFAHWLLNNKSTTWIINPSKYIHTPKDVPNNVNIELLNNCLKLITGFLLEKTKD